jgi:hypothetical protein
VIFQFSEANIIVPDAVILKISWRQEFLTHQVHMASKVYFLAQFDARSKTEKSRRVIELRLVCVGLHRR